MITSYRAAIAPPEMAASAYERFASEKLQDRCKSEEHRSEAAQGQRLGLGFLRGVRNQLLS